MHFFRYIKKTFYVFPELKLCYTKERINSRTHLESQSLHMKVATITSMLQWFHECQIYRVLSFESNYILTTFGWKSRLLRCKCFGTRFLNYLRRLQETKYGAENNKQVISLYGFRACLLPSVNFHFVMNLASFLHAAMIPPQQWTSSRFLSLLHKIHQSAERARALIWTINAHIPADHYL